jgi:3-oxoacyl-[acyl-carrier protein] reductase
MNILHGKRALVTGGSRGIGAAISEALAENGANVAFTYQSSATRAEEVIGSIQRLGRAGFAIRADSADLKAVHHAVSASVEKLGGLDILVNSAAVGMVGPLADVDLNEFQLMMDINVRAPVAFAKAAIPHLTAGGRIISIASALADRVPFPGVTAYAMSKSALLSFTRGLSRELGPQGITVNLVMPGSTDTEANPADGAGSTFQKSLSSIGRYAEPREIAEAVVFLAGPGAGMVNGSTLTVDGGANA